MGIRLLVNGIGGYMGREVARLCSEGYHGAELSGGVDPSGNAPSGVSLYRSVDEIDAVDFDCIIDFSHHSAAPELLSFAVAQDIPVVLATTGHTDDELACIREASESIPVFFAANMSLGIALLARVATQVAESMPDATIEIVEKHHIRKLDAPSGTALMLAEELCSVRPEAYLNCGRSGHARRDENEIGIHSVRMGNIVGEHEVIIGTAAETITLKHEAHSRALFAEGAITAAEFIVECPKGLYNMKDMVSLGNKNMAIK